MSLVDDPTVTVGDTVAAEDAAAGADTGELAELPIVEPGSYKLAGEHARGGLGRVIKAFDRRLGRTVAVKELLRLAPEARARFVREAKITARLQHPAIVPIYEAGRWPSGEPFYAMKMVSGRPLSEVIRETKTVADRLALLPNVIAVAEAIAYAHREGVIHRDLKPSNVLVGEFGETVVIDWGIAKDLRDTDAPDVDAGPYRAPEDGRTVAGSVLGTPAYMPPEQARGQTVDARADIYALGALVYHMLAGAPPYGDVRDGTTVLQAVIEGPPTDIGRQVPDAPDDLLAITRKAMARDPADRYATAAELAADIRRFQTGQLVSAHRYSLAAMLRKWIARHRAPVAVGAIALVALALGGAFSIRRIIAERETAEHQRETAETRRNELILLQARASLQTDPTESLQWLKEYPLDATDWPTAHAIADEAAKRGYARWVWDGFDGYLTVVDISPDGSKVAVGTSSGDVVLLDSETGEREVIKLHDGTIYDVQFANNGSALVIGDDTGLAVHWSLTTGNQTSLKIHNGAVNSIAVTASGTLVATAGDDGTAAIWEPVSGEVQRFDHSAPVIDLGFTRDSTQLVTATADGKVWARAVFGDAAIEVSDLGGPLLALLVGEDGVVASTARDRGIALAKLGVPGFGQPSGPQGARLVTQSSTSHIFVSHDGGALTCWNEAGELVEKRRLPIDATGLAAATKAPVIVAGLVDGTLWTTDEEAGTDRVLRGHSAVVVGVAISDDGRRIASISRDGHTRLWTVPARMGRRLLAIPESTTHVDSDDAGEWIALASSTGDVFVAQRPAWRAHLLGQHSSGVIDVRFGAASNHFATADASGGVALWSPDGLVARSDLHISAQSVRYCSAGNAIAVSDTGGFIHIIDLATSATRNWRGHDAVAHTMRFDRSCALIATASPTGSVRVWQVSNGDLLWEAEIPGAAKVAFRGEALLVTTRTGNVVQATSDGSTQVLASPASGTGSSDVATSGLLAASSRGDGAVELLWPVTEARETVLFPLGDIGRLSVAADGSAIVALQGSETLRVALVPDGRPSAIVLSGHPHEVVAVPNGAAVVTTDPAGTAWLWHTDAATRNAPPAGSAELAAWLARATARGR